MKFKEAVMQADADKVAEVIKKEYPDQIELIEDFKKLLEDLKNMEPAAKEEDITVAVDWAEPEEDLETEGHYRVHGYEPGKDLFWSIEVSPRDQWLAWKADKRFIMMNGVDKYIAHCLWEMTFCGFEQADIDEFISEIGQRVEDVKDTEVKIMSWKEAKETLNLNEL